MKTNINSVVFLHLVFLQLVYNSLNVSTNATQTSATLQFEITEYVLKLTKTLHVCASGLTMVTFEDPLGYPTHILHHLEVSYITSTEFINVGLTMIKHSRGFNRCIMFLPHENGTNTTRNLINQVDENFKDLQVGQTKPSIIFIWPKTLRVQNATTQNQILKKSFENTQFKINTNVLTVFISYQSVSKSLKSSIWEIYTVKNELIFHKLLAYNEELTVNSEMIIGLSNKVRRRADFKGQPIIASVREEENQADWMSLRKINGTLVLVGGTSAFLYWDLQKMLNFTEKLIVGDSVVTLPNNSLAGKTITQINTGLADISLSQSLVVGFRAKEITFLQPTYFGIMTVFFQQPSANSIRNIVTAPFETSLWISLISTWIFLIGTVKISLYFKKICQHKPVGDVFSERIRSKLNSKLKVRRGRNLINSDIAFSSELGFWAITVSCQKSWYINPSSFSVKMIFIIGSLCSVVSYVAYSAAIVSTLSVNVIPVETFIDLITFKFVFTVHAFSEPFQDLLKRMIQSYALPQEVVKTTTENEISHLLNPLQPRAFLTYPDLFYQTALQLNYSETFICDHISKVRVSDFPYKSAMFVKKSSELVEIFNHKIIILKERGFNYRYMQSYEQKNVFSCVQSFSRNSQVEPVLFRDVFTAFLVLFIGVVAAAISLLSEAIFIKICRNAKQKSQIC